MKVVALLGARGAGKTAVSAYFEARGWHVYRPDTTKALVVRELFGLADVQLRGVFRVQSDPLWLMSPVEMERRLALAIESEFGSDIWVRRCLLDAKAHRIDKVVIDGVDPELAVSQGFELVTVVREGLASVHVDGALTLTNPAPLFGDDSWFQVLMENTLTFIDQHWPKQQAEEDGEDEA